MDEAKRLIDYILAMEDESQKRRALDFIANALMDEANYGYDEMVKWVDVSTQDSVSLKE